VSDREDAILERFLENLDSGGPAGPPADLTPDEARLWREVGLSGLLPYALEPVAPSVATREKLLASLRADRAEPLPFPVPAPATAASSGALRLIAAALAVLSLGLAGWSGWMLRDNRAQQLRLAELNEALLVSEQREQGLRSAAGELAGFRNVMMGTGLRSCPLKPPVDSPVQPVARAAVLFDAEARNWLLTARDLEPCRDGQEYTLWFIVDGRPVPGGVFHVKEGEPVSVAADSMPAGTTAMLLTLEPAPGSEEPLGPTILYGDESDAML
jgi:hypothetical protein